MNAKKIEYADLIENIYMDIKNRLLFKVHYEGEKLIELRDYMLDEDNLLYGWARNDFWRILIEDTIKDLICGEYDYLEFKNEPF